MIGTTPQGDGRLALVAGAGGLVGGHLVERLLEGGWSVIGVARKTVAHPSPQYRHLSCDLVDEARCVELAGECRGVTHLFYTARASHSDPAIESSINVALLRNVLDGMLAESSQLEHVSLVHGTKWYGSHLGRFRTPATESDPRHEGDNWYFGQHDYIASLQRSRQWGWSTVRPHIVVGLSVGYPYNCLNTIAAYAALCREQGRPFAFPGTEAAFDAISQATDATLLAKALIWTATDRACDGQDFNIVNADYFRWRNLWPAVADFFELVSAGPGGDSLSTTMRDAGPAWEALVRRHGLARVPLESVASWTFGDFLFRTDWDVMSSTLKARRCGFQEAVGTEESFLRQLARMRAARLIP